VIQVYVSPVVNSPVVNNTVAGSAEAATRPRRWLAGFASVTAGPGESATVTIGLPERTWQVWAGGWVTIGGEYTIEAAHSLDDVRSTASIRVTA
jgi:beta-glucosidase